ncbi:MAG: hypothetical protein SFW66_04425, partial [Gammaproteobacteria bacterium]|nr:hypothetical protein [Gammaproteobacteria bacterium]
LVCAEDNNRRKWLQVYNDFSAKIIHSDILYVGLLSFFSKKESAVNLFLKDNTIKQKFEKIIKRYEILNADLTKLSSDEIKQVEDQRREIATEAWQNLLILQRDHLHYKIIDIDGDQNAKSFS